MAEVALEIEAELAGAEYEATPDESATIDEWLAGEAGGEEEIRATFAGFQQACGSNTRSGPSPIFDKSHAIMLGLAIQL